MDENQKLQDLGYANGWKDTPKIVKKCQHVVESKSEGRCLTRYTCKACGYTYLVDSSD